jgi:hypothetical protein
MWYRWFSDHPYSYMGAVVIRLCPAPYLKRVQEDFLLNPLAQSEWQKIVKAGLRRRYFAQDESDVAGANRAHFWGGVAGRKWHQMKTAHLRDPEAFRQEFEQFRGPIATHLGALVQADPSYTTLCEIGTGNGLFLQYLSHLEALHAIPHLVGLDLNAEQIEENRKMAAGSRVSFLCVEVRDWISKERRDGTIFLTHETLHNFTPAELESLLDSIRRIGRAAIILSEPIDVRLPAAARSKPRGGIGISFSHNYARYLREREYTILSEEVVPNQYPMVASYDHRVIVACVGAPRTAAPTA